MQIATVLRISSLTSVLWNNENILFIPLHSYKVSNKGCCYYFYKSFIPDERIKQIELITSSIISTFECDNNLINSGIGFF
jgi:hypothetical protein